MQSMLHAYGGVVCSIITSIKRFGMHDYAAGAGQEIEAREQH